MSETVKTNPIVAISIVRFAVRMEEITVGITRKNTPVEHYIVSKERANALSTRFINMIFQGKAESLPFVSGRSIGSTTYFPNYNAVSDDIVNTIMERRRDA